MIRRVLGQDAQHHALSILCDHDCHRTDFLDKHGMTASDCYAANINPVHIEGRRTVNYCNGSVHYFDLDRLLGLYVGSTSIVGCGCSIEINASKGLFLSLQIDVGLHMMTGAE